MFFGGKFYVFGFLLREGVILNLANSIFRDGKSTLEIIRYLSLAFNAAAKSSSLFESHDCTNYNLCGHYVFTAHHLVLEIIEDVFVFLHITPSHRLHNADLQYVTSVHFSFAIDVLNHVYKMLAF